MANLGKVLDADDSYYQEFSSVDSSSNGGNTSTRENPPTVSRSSTLRVHKGPRVTGNPLEENRSKDNPYDYRKLLRKTSQRRRLIQLY
uniref:Uncharacterized protein n=1 Tax=Sphaerodactylus townsendi TaxID=933632 RepID=A0ACB8FW17_9SAUR